MNENEQEQTSNELSDNIAQAVNEFSTEDSTDDATEQVEEGYEETADEQDDTEDVSQEEEPVEEEFDDDDDDVNRIEQLESKMNNMLSLLQQQQAATQSVPPPTYQPPMTVAPKDLDDMSTKELAEFITQQANMQTATMLNMFGKDVGRRLQVLGEMVDIFSKSHPDHKHVPQVIELVGNSNMSVADAMKAVKGLAAAEQNRKLKKQRKKQNVHNRRRAQKAARGRPTGTPGPQTKITSIEDAMRAAAKEQGLVYESG